MLSSTISSAGSSWPTHRSGWRITISGYRVLGVDENRILGGDRLMCMDIDGGKLPDLLEKRDVATKTAHSMAVRQPRSSLHNRRIWPPEPALHT